MENLIKCRLCSSELHERICFLPAMPLTDEFVSVDQVRNEFIRDINIYQCVKCGLVQNPIDFDHEGYYENYEYSSGHSDFTRSFMRSYALAVCDAFRSVHGRNPTSVLEIGSGDGEQLRIFQELGVAEVLGIEPSEVLVRQSKKIGVPAYKGLFSLDMIDDLPRNNFDICLSSYTLDHVRNPADYLRAANELLVQGGVLAFEVHDLSRISERGEWCLFEHEHTIYMDADMARMVVRLNGFEVYVVNPLLENIVRANSLILIGHKSGNVLKQANLIPVDYSGLQKRIDLIAERIDAWIDALPPSDELVGYGAGGRGVMTLAALRNADRFSTIFDSNHPSWRYSTPKTHVAVSGLDRLADFNKAHCLVFSFGYITEITANLEAAGYQRNRIVSLASFLG
jgi:SAM-dependent methyltransferase